MIFWRYKTLVFSIFMLILLSSCKPHQKEKLVLENPEGTLIDSVSSGSGICCTSKGFWLVGDDSPHLYFLNTDAKMVKSYQLSLVPDKGQERYNKATKPDFEALDIFNDTLLIIGSGSQPIVRDTAYLFDTKKGLLLGKKSLHNLYQQFYLHGDFPVGKSINIEGLANNGTYFYFFHRGNSCGNNRIYRVAKTDFLRFFTKENENLPVFDSYVYDLPQIDGVQTGFSGATYCYTENALYVTLSAEATNDAYNDGEIQGSYIGQIQLKKDIPQKIKLWPIKYESDFLPTKLESICLPPTNKEKRIFAISDNDDGTTKLYRFSVQQK